MEINKEKIKINYKAIFDYCFRVFVFLMLNRKLFFNKIFIFALSTSMFVEKFCKFEDPFLIPIVFLFLFLFIYTYLTAKLCGLFKKLNSTNIRISFLIVIIIDIISFLISCLNFENLPKITIQDIGTIFPFLLTMSYILYKFFSFLTKKYPKMFKKVEYYTSIEFFKSLYSKITKK